MPKREMTPREKSNGALALMVLIPFGVLVFGCTLLPLAAVAWKSIQEATTTKQPVELVADPKPSDADERWRKAKLEADKELARREEARKAEFARAFRGGPKTSMAKLVSTGDSFEQVVRLLGQPETVRYEDGPTPGSPKLLDYYWSNGECTPVSITFEGRGRNRSASGVNTGALCEFQGQPLSKSSLKLPGKSCKRNRLCK